MPSFGAKLKQQREQRDVTLDEISQTTKIGTRFLRALEEDRFDQLPGGIFNKGFVRAYARCVGMDEDEAIADYMAATGAVAEKPESQTSLPEARPEPPSDGAARVPWGTVALVLVCGALVLAIWGVHKRKARIEESQQPSPSTQTTSSPTIMIPPAPAQNAQQTPSMAAPAQKPVAVAPASAAPDSTLALPINLQIHVREDSWISIAADGKEILRGTMVAAAEKSVHAAREIVVKAGNVGAIDFEFNGKKLPSQGDTGEVKTLIFDASGAHAMPSQPTAPGTQNNAPPQP